MPAEKAREVVAHIIGLKGEAVCRCTATGDLAIEFPDGVVSTNTAAATFGVAQDVVYTPSPTSPIGRALANPGALAFLTSLAASMTWDGIKHAGVALYAAARVALGEPSGEAVALRADPPAPPPPALIQLDPPQTAPTAMGEREPTPAPPLPPLIGPDGPRRPDAVASGSAPPAPVSAASRTSRSDP